MLKRIIQATRMKVRKLFSARRQYSADTPKSINQSTERREFDLPASQEVVRGSGIDGEASSSAASRRKRKKRKKWQLEDFKVEPAEGKVRFHDIDLPLNVMRGIADAGFKYCTPIQAEALPQLLKGDDLVGNANTGTGKSAVFLITIISHILKRKKRSPGAPAALILGPTRELVVQIAKDAKRLSSYTGLKVLSVYGGENYRKQIDLLKQKKSDILVATPGRLLDFIYKGIVELDKVDILVIDEADRMLDMGFIPDVRKVIHKLPDKDQRQTMMFSATITDDVTRLASQWCEEPVRIDIEPEVVAVDTVEQKIYLVTTDEKYLVLYNLLKINSEKRSVVFANQKNEAKRLADRLRRNGIHAVLLTGDVQQKKRMERLERFRSGRVKVLVATDVAGRGIHIEDISYVINYNLPYEPEDYVHRIGRTGRAGASGIAIGFACEEGGFVLPDIEEYIGRKLDCIVPEEYLLEKPPRVKADNVKTNGKVVSHRPGKKKYHGRKRGRGDSQKRGNPHK